MTDSLTPAERSTLMSKVRARGNSSTEMRVMAKLIEIGISGWVRHPSCVLGQPDFFFSGHRIAVFVDGCFWHGCPKCGRIPKTRVKFWQEKIGGNRRRDRAVTRKLRRQELRVMRVWEHALHDDRWIRRLLRMLSRCGGS